MADYKEQILTDGSVIRTRIDPQPETPDREILTRLEFMSRFTDTELEGIFTAAKTTVSLEVYLEKLKAAQDVTVTDARTIAGVEQLAAAGLIAADRVAAILAPEPGA